MKKQKAVVTETVVVETVIEQVTKQLGRPVNPNSARQQRIAELETKRAAGQCKRGRPTVAGSKRQEVLAARAAKAANGGEIKRGRPVNPDSDRQKRLNKTAETAA
jgi:hypothetical protein